MNRSARYLTAMSIILIVIIPISILIVWAFTLLWPYPDLVPSFTTHYLKFIMDTGILTKPLMNSVLLSLIVTGLSFILGFLPAKYLGTKEFKGKRALQVFVMLPALAPGIAIVFGMMPVFMKLDLYLTFEALVIGQITFTLPYMIMVLSSSFRNYDTDYEAQSTTLGMGKIDTFLHVTLPMIKSSAAVACMYTFMVSWSMYLFTSMYLPKGFSTLVTTLLPMAASSSAIPQEIAITTILFFLPSLIFLIATTLIIKSDNANERGGQI